MEDSCEPARDDGESLVDKEDVICCHLTTHSYYNSGNKDFSISNDIQHEPVIETVDVEFTPKFIYEEPIVETVDPKFTPKFVYKDAKELFPTANAGAEPTPADSQEPVIQQQDTKQTDSTHQQTDSNYVKFDDTKSIMDNDTPHKSCPDFQQGEE